MLLCGKFVFNSLQKSFFFKIMVISKKEAFLI